MKPLKNGTQVLTESENVKGTSHNLKCLKYKKKSLKYIKPQIILESNTFLRYSSRQDFDLHLLKWLAIFSL